jgi:excisionase family DNA binding protein
MPDWVSVKEAVELTGYHPYYLRELIRNEKISAEKKGNSWWVDREALLSYITAAGAAKHSDKRHGPRKSKRKGRLTKTLQ